MIALAAAARSRVRRVRPLRVSLALLSLYAALLAVTGCDVAAAMQASQPCNDACRRYHACFDDELDVDRCAGACVDNASGNERFETDMHRCDTCMDIEGCRAHPFDCFDECGFVLGQTAVDL